MAAHPRVDCLVFALSAYAGALAGFLDPAAIESPGEFENPIIAQAKTAIAIAAHASGKTCTHNPFRDTDPQAAGRHAQNARGRFGFSRMTAHELAHIEPVVDAMRPDAAQIRQAGEGLLAAQAADWLPIRRDGQFHDRPSYRFWWILLSRAHAAGAPLPDDVRQAFFATDTDPKTRTSP
ncbi:MAG: hypothetical protein NTV19_17305 [Burkholderiales bacterium]|nr:hypothetical protein [Burkholderiales bacterium]